MNCVAHYYDIFYSSLKTEHTKNHTTNYYRTNGPKSKKKGKIVQASSCSPLRKRRVSFRSVESRASNRRDL